VSFGSVVATGPLILAIPVAAAAGAITFVSPCCLPLMPGYLAYVTGMSGAEADRVSAADGAPENGAAGPTGSGPAPGGSGAAAAATASLVATATRVTARQPPGRGRTVLGAALFVLGFSALFAVYGGAFGMLGSALRTHQQVVTQILGAVTILLGLLFAGVFDRLAIAGRIVKPSIRPRAGLAGAPLLGVLFGLGWTPCIGPTLQVVLALGFTSGTAARGAFLAFVYSLGLGVPLLIMAVTVQRGTVAFGWARRHARLITRIGGGMLVVVGLLEVTGTWSAAMSWLQVHWISGYVPPI
jgi:cytochrome c-type biogenesis protein